MKAAWISLVALFSTSAFANSLQPGYYSAPDRIDAILKGHYDNFSDRMCPSELLRMTGFQVHVALGDKLIGLRIEAKAEGGTPFYYIWPEFDRNSTGMIAAQRCYVTNF